jgi:hypothetical protein
MAAKGYQGRHSADAAPAGTRSPKVPQDAPAKPGTKAATATRRRGPQHDSGETKPKPGLSASAKSKRDARVRRVTDEAREYATRAAMRRTEGRPSVVGRAAAGAAAGGATGAAVGGPVGAAAGGVIGGVGGAVAGRKAKKAYDVATSSSPGARRIIVIEFLLCMVVSALSPLTDRKKDEGPTTHMKRMTAVMGLFFILGLLSAGGRGAAKFAAGFGGLVTVAVAISNRDLFMRIGDIFGKVEDPLDPESNVPDPVLEPGQGRDNPGTMP